MKLSLIVPCYNEQENVERFFNACESAFKNKIESYEIIFINDGSGDNTWHELKKLYSLKTSNIKLINFSRNFGKESAMYAGLKAACGEYVTIIDADLQQRPELAAEMVEFLETNEDYDCVAAYQQKRCEGKLMSICKNMFYKIINMVCEIDFKSSASDFRTLRKNVVSAILEMKEYYRFSKGIFSWVGFNTYYMPYDADQRTAGSSTWSVGKLIKYACEGFVSFTTFPLKIATFIGSLLSVCSLIYMITVIIQKLCFGNDVPGYPTIVVLILLIGGIQLITLGIIGEYIAHIYIEGKRRPIYITKEYLTYEEAEHDDK